VGVSIYTLMFKLPGGEFADDWMHTVIHVVWGAAAAYAGWITPSLAQPFTLATIAVYGTLLIMGVATEGLFLDREFRIPLDAAANVFHLGLFSLGVGFVSRAKVAGAARS
jgi:MFS-type transporter involved in bile tolerance (Atg22 family)